MISDIFGLLREGVVIIGPDGLVQSLNLPAAALLGADDATGKPWTDLVASLVDQGGPPLDDLQALLGGASERLGSVTLTSRGGKIKIRFRAKKIEGGEVALILEKLDAPDETATADLAPLLTAIEQAADAIVVTDPNGVIQYVNPAFGQITGYSPVEAVGKDPSILKSGEHDDAFYKNIWETITSGNVWRGEIVNRRKSGQLYVDRASIAPVTGLEGKITHFVSVKRDITEKIEARKNLEQSHKLFDAIGQVESQFISGAGSVATYETLLDILVRLTGSKYGLIAELGQESGGAQKLRVKAISNIAWDEETRRLFDERNQGGGMIFANLDNLIGRVVTGGEPVIANNPGADPRRGGLPPGHPPLDSFMGLPIMRGDDVVGMAGVANRQGGYDDEMATFISPLLGVMATIMEAVWAESERQAAEASVREYAQELARADELKNKMISIVSHDLRAPFATNIGLLKILSQPGRDPLTGKQQEIVDTLIRSLEHQLKLVVNLLELSRLHRGVVSLEPQVVEAAAIMDECVAIYGPSAEAKGVTLRNECAAGLLVTMDRTRLLQAIGNLVTNAVKFTEPGGEITLKAEAPPKGELRFQVADTGVGIDPGLIGKLLEISEHTSTLGTKGERGTGLGLSICRELTELLGGVVEIESTPGKGTAATLRFPLPGERGDS